MRILVFILLTTLCSCHTIKTTTDNSAKSKVDLENLAIENADNSIEKVEEVKTECGSRLITYDTSKPVDVKTGRPPIQSELMTEQKSWSENQSNAKSKSKITSKQKSNLKTESNNQTTQSRTFDWRLWVVLALFVIVAIWLGLHFRMRLFY